MIHRSASLDLAVTHRWGRGEGGRGGGIYLGEGTGNLPVWV